MSMLQSQMDKHTRRSKIRPSELAGAYLAGSTSETTAPYALGARVDYASEDSAEFRPWRSGRLRLGGLRRVSSLPASG